MPITLGSNIASLRGQRSLNKATNELRSVYERLSSGQRINRASDDTAGLAVSESLKADTRIFTQGIRNVNDGISLLSIADSALENLSTIVTRLQELAEQASNGVYGTKQREALDAEAQTLAKEFTRIQQSTTFNGISLLNGSLSNLQIQAGIGDSAILDLGVGGKIGTGAMGSLQSSFLVNGNIIIGLTDLNYDGFQDLVTYRGISDQANIMLGNGDGSFGSQTSYTLDVNSGSIALGDFNGDGNIDIVSANQTSNTVGFLLGKGDGTFNSAVNSNIGFSAVGYEVGDINADGNLDLVARTATNSIETLLGNGDGTFSVGSSLSIGASYNQVVLEDLTGDGVLDLAVASGTNLNIYSGYGDGTFSSTIQSQNVLGATASELIAKDFNNDGKIDLASASSTLTGARVFLNQGDGTFNTGTEYATTSGPYTLISADFNGDGYQDIATGFTSGFSINLNRGDGTFGSATLYSAGVSYRQSLISGDINQDGVLDIVGSTSTSIHSNLGNTTDGVSPILAFSLKTMADAKQALTQFKNKSNLLNIQRGEIGAYQSRLSTANNVISSAKENVETAESRIRDADIAEESSKLVRNRILQQASSSILAQANLQPELALRLLS